MSTRTVHAADLFCGAGGETTGMFAAASDAGVDLRLLAVNHWEMAIETHSRNHPWAKHLCESLQSIDPVVAVPGGRLQLLWASPECTHHSNARGGRPRSDQSRASAWLILKWLSELYVDRVIVENVPEFINWGPLGADGKVMHSRRGETFTAWIRAIESLGYRVDWRLLRAADYGDPTTRTRLFVQAARGRKTIVWPEPTHSAEPEIFNRSPWVPAREVIDWSIPGEPIIGRRRPLRPATLARIEAGIRKYWGEFAEPFLVILRGTGSFRDVHRPLPAITAGGKHLALVQAFLVQSEHGCRVRSVNAPLNTITCSSRGFGLVEPFICPIDHRAMRDGTRGVSDPLSTITTKARHGVCRPFIVKYYGTGGRQSVDVPLDTVTTRDRFGIVTGDQIALDIRFRMLMPHELAAAQGFPSGYWFAGNRSEQVRQIGNAVPCGTAKALCREALAA